MGIASLHHPTNYAGNDAFELIPRDDLAFALMDLAGLSKSPARRRTKISDGGRGSRCGGGDGRPFARNVFHQLRQREDVAHFSQADTISSRSELTHSGMDSEGSRCTSTTVCASSQAAQRDAEKVVDADVDGHPHALDGRGEHDGPPPSLILRTPPSDGCRGAWKLSGRERGSSRSARLDLAGLLPLVDV